MNQLNISDVFRPLSAQEILSAQNAGIQLKLNEMSLREAQDKIRKDKQINDLLSSSFQGRNDLAGSIGKINPSMAMQMDADQKKMMEKKRQTDMAILSKGYAEAIKKGDSDYVNAYADVLRSEYGLPIPIGFKSKGPNKWESPLTVKNGKDHTGKPVTVPGHPDMVVPDGDYIAFGDMDDKGQSKITKLKKAPMSDKEKMDYRAGIESKQEVQKQKNRIALENYKKSHGIKSSSSSSLPSNMEKIVDLLGEGRMYPSQAKSRAGKDYLAIIARTAEKYPDYDAEEAESIGKMRANASIALKQANIKNIPDLIKKVSDIGKSLNFSDFAPLGSVQAHYKALTNDEAYRKYASMRTDALQTITTALKLTGATDQTIKQEIKAAPDAMSPRAFKGWYEGQMESLLPKVKDIMNITKPKSYKKTGVSGDGLSLGKNVKDMTNEELMKSAFGG